MKDQKGIAHLVLIIVGVFAVAGAIGVVTYIQSNQSDISNDVEQSQAEQQAQTTQDYPDLWAQANMPQYPGATITKKREGRNLNDGVQITFNTSDTPAQVETYYDAEMTNRSFTVPTTPGATVLVYFGIYKNGTKQLTITATVDEDSGDTKVNAKYVEL